MPEPTPVPLRKITVLELFEMAESLYADYEEPKLRYARAQFADLAQKERDGVLRAGDGDDWVREAMISMTLAAIGGDMTRDEIED